ncbi:MAG: methionine--tRNA ligase [Pseudomonadota bacterium]
MTTVEKQRRIIATSALPYANGAIHVGHLVEYLQTDFWIRFQKMRGHKAIYICADDTHGTPIMIRARQEEIEPEQLIAKSQEEHQRDFAGFQIQFDHYSSTHSEENKQLAHQIFAAMENNNHIELRNVEQSYCEHDKMFLPDRFVVGNCPNCGADNQYGDSCDSCGATYSPTDLKNPGCAICGNTPVKRASEHLFFQLDHFRDFLQDWVPKHTQSEVSNKLKEWLDDELRAWDISRDEPYFGFEIPGHPGKYFYVWVDAPIGYLSSTKQWCDQQGLDFQAYWNDPKTEIFHFIGKDIVYFHALFWPAMLKNAELKTPDRICVHGFLTVNGEKMSKSKGTFIGAAQFLNHLDPAHLRYYYACKLNGIGDIDLNFEDFANRVNSDLIGKITNLGSRGAQMTNKKLGGSVGRPSQEGLEIIKKAQEKAGEIADLFENLNFAKAMVEIRELADLANRYFDEKAPWKMIKEDEDATKEVLADILNIFRILTIYLKPILPLYAEKVESLFGEASFTWDSAQEIRSDFQLNPFEHLSQRVDSSKIEELIEASKV